MAVTRGLFQSGSARRQKLTRKLESACAMLARSTLPKFPRSRKTNNSRRAGRACSYSGILTPSYSYCLPDSSSHPHCVAYIVFLSAITWGFYGVLGLAFRLIYVWGNGYGVFSDSLVVADLYFFGWWHLFPMNFWLLYLGEGCSFGGPNLKWFEFDLLTVILT